MAQLDRVASFSNAFGTETRELQQSMHSSHSSWPRGCLSSVTTF